MQAIAVSEPGGPDNLHWIEAPTPEPGQGEVRIRVVAAGVNRADLLQRQGHYPPPKGVTDILGMEVSGVVDAIGASRADTCGPKDQAMIMVPALRPYTPKVGDEVIALLPGGGYAQYVTVQAGQCAPKPASIDFDVAAGLMETAATVVSNFDHILLTRGETILIHGGAGGIGSFAIPYAVHLGARVITTVGSQEKADYVRGLGANAAIDYHGDWVSEIGAATDGRGVDAILDIIGAKYLEDNVRVLARGGRMVIIGMQGGTKGTLDINRLLTKGATITATSLRFRPVVEKCAIVSKVAREVLPLFESGRIPLPPITTFPMSQAQQAHEWLESGKNQGKVVLIAE